MHLEQTLAYATCNICGQQGEFLISGLNPESDEPITTQLRDNVFCQGCGSICRDRMLIHGLQEVLDTSTPLSVMIPNKDIRVLETSGARAHPKYLESLYDYYNISYHPEIMKGESYDTRKYGDLENLRFQDDYFDVILSSDVFEHVRLYEKAFLEVFRVLRPGAGKSPRRQRRILCAPAISCPQCVGLYDFWGFRLDPLTLEDWILR